MATLLLLMRFGGNWINNMVVKNKNADWFKITMVLFGLCVSLFTGFSSYVLVHSERYSVDTRRMVTIQTERHRADLQGIRENYVHKNEYSNNMLSIENKFIRIDTKFDKIIMR